MGVVAAAVALQSGEFVNEVAANRAFGKHARTDLRQRWCNGLLARLAEHHAAERQRLKLAAASARSARWYQGLSPEARTDRHLKRSEQRRQKQRIRRMRAEQEMARGPNPTVPPWEMVRGWQPLLHGTVGAGLLTAAVLGAADTSNALLPALMRIVDETMPLALASASLPPHASALSAFAAAQTAATALSLLAHVLDLLGGAAPQWARPAAVQRMQWVVAQPQCPMPVRQAASRGLQRMQGTTSPPPPGTRTSN